jgi:hypothetical protein
MHSMANATVTLVVAVTAMVVGARTVAAVVMMA